MARSLIISASEWEVFLDDVTESQEVPDPDNEGQTITKDVDGVKAFPVDDDTPDDASIFVLKSVLLPTSLKVGQLARKGQFDDAVYIILRKSLKGWKRIGDGKGGQIPFNQKNIDLIPMEDATALALYVMDKVAGSSSKTSEDRDLGNS